MEQHVLTNKLIRKTKKVDGQFVTKDIRTEDGAIAEATQDSIRMITMKLGSSISYSVSSGIEDDIYIAFPEEYDEHPEECPDHLANVVFLRYAWARCSADDGKEPS